MAASFHVMIPTAHNMSTVVHLTVGYWFFFQTSSDGNSTTSVLTFVPVKPTKSRHQESGGRDDEHGTSDFDGRLTCRAENPQHEESTAQQKHTIAASSDSFDDAGTPFIQSTWLLRIQCEYYLLRLYVFIWWHKRVKTLFVHRKECYNNLGFIW